MSDAKPPSQTTPGRFRPTSRAARNLLAIRQGGPPPGRATSMKSSTSPSTIRTVSQIYGEAPAAEKPLHSFEFLTGRPGLAEQAA